MSFVSDREKELPAIPIDRDDSTPVEEDLGLGPIPSPECVMPAPMFHQYNNTDDVRSEEEAQRLQELWKGAGMSARAYRTRRCHDQRRIPAPISIADPENVPPTLVVLSGNPSTTSTTPTTGTRRRWGFMSGRPFSETQEAEQKAPNALAKLRAMAQDRLKRKLRYAKSAPNLGDRVTARGRGIASQPLGSTPDEVAIGNRRIRTRRNLASPGRSAIPEADLQRQDTDENAIYFTVDPNWRSSQGSVRFEPITPIPERVTPLGRPDSPLLHRHHSLDQLSFAAQQVAPSLTEDRSREEDLDAINELYAYMER